ncbi:hypothetical protein L204_105744 [Cryptococcus depauperatus]|nr:hypothetical protein L204_06451 [Cryptococcus depauperatus CBS 7855]
MVVHDASDAEQEDSVKDSTANSVVDASARAAVHADMDASVNSTSTDSANGYHPLKVTLRPNISHLIDGSSGSLSTSSPPASSQRSKSKHAMADRAQYSSSEDDDSAHTSPPRKKKKVSSSTRSTPTKGTRVTLKVAHLSPSASRNAGQVRRNYEWLQLSEAGASHHGPPERRVGSVADTNEHVPSTAEEAISGLLDLAMDREGGVEKLKGSRKKADAPSRAWKKNVKNKTTASLPLKDEADTTPTNTPGLSAVGTSREPSPAPLSSPQLHSTLHPALSPVASPPFLLADSTQLGFPVFSRPIITPKISVGNFPKVTNYFAPVNGGDTGPFPRRERTRRWTWQERSIIGVGGGALRIKIWSRGPTSELERAMQKEAGSQSIQRQPKQKGITATGTPSTPQHQTESSHFESSNLAAAPLSADRFLVPAPSFDNASPTPGDDESEAGSEDTVSVGNSPVGGKKTTPKGLGKKKGKTPKSKLAQEIVMDEVEERP